MHIQRACYYLKGKHILKDTKTFTSNRRISIPTALTESLKEYKVWYDDTKSKLGNLWSKSNKLVLTDEGKIVNANNLVKWLCKILVKAELPKVALHSISHTNITLQIVNSVDIRTVSAHARNSKTSITTCIYSLFVSASDGHACSVIDKIFE